MCGSAACHLRPLMVRCCIQSHLSELSQSRNCQDPGLCGSFVSIGHMAAGELAMAYLKRFRLGFVWGTSFRNLPPRHTAVATPAPSQIVHVNSSHGRQYSVTPKHLHRNAEYSSAVPLRRKQSDVVLNKYHSSRISSLNINDLIKHGDGVILDAECCPGCGAPFQTTAPDLVCNIFLSLLFIITRATI